MKRFYRNADIEDIADSRLLEMARAMGKPLTLPVPIDYLAEQVLGLDLLWDEVQELPGELILGAIMPARKLIILNELRRDYMEQHPGLERSTKGHEMGHWDLYVDKATLHHPASRSPTISCSDSISWRSPSPPWANSSTSLAAWMALADHAAPIAQNQSAYQLPVVERAI